MRNSFFLFAYFCTFVLMNISCSKLKTISVGQATLYARSHAATGQGYFVGQEQVQGSGKALITIDGKIFRGTWVVLPKGSTSLGILAAKGPAGNLVAGGAGVNMDATVPGQATMISDDGQMLRCEFIGSRYTKAASGVCVDRQDAVYDIQIVFGQYVSREEADALINIK